jgi:hypothetical protein
MPRRLMYDLHHGPARRDRRAFVSIKSVDFSRLTRLGAQPEGIAVSKN